MPSDLARVHASADGEEADRKAMDWETQVSKSVLGRRKDAPRIEDRTIKYVMGWRVSERMSRRV